MTSVTTKASVGSSIARSSLLTATPTDPIRLGVVAQTLSAVTQSATGSLPDSLLTDLIAWWSLDETSGTRADSHTNSINLTDNNTVGYAAGKVSNAADFEEDNSEYLNNTSAGALEPSGDMTIAFWFQAESTHASNNRTMVSIGDAATAAIFIALYMNSGYSSPSTLRTAFYTDTATIAANWSESNLATGTWHHAIIAWDDSENEIQVQVNNGTAVTATGTGTLRGPVGKIHLGGDTIGGGNHDGLLDEVVVWHRLLTSAEKTRLYNSGSGIGYPG